MKLAYSRKQSLKVLKILEEEVLNGEILHKEEVIRRFLGNINTPLQYLNSKKMVSGWFYSLKRRFTINHHAWFGCIDDSGGYGLANKEAEGRSAMTRYYNFMRGVGKRATFLSVEIKKKGLLPVKEEKFILPKPNGKKGKEKNNE